MSKQLVVNLFGVPGAGKSSMATTLHSLLSQRGIVSEITGEFAKDLCFEGASSIPLSCQEYVFGQQSYRQERLRGKVDIIISDSPLPFNVYYARQHSQYLDRSFDETVMRAFESYRNINVWIDRSHPYSETGRFQNQKESDAMVKAFRALWRELGVAMDFSVQSDKMGLWVREMLVPYLEREVKEQEVMH